MSAKELINILSRQFLCCYSLTNLDCKRLINPSWDEQKLLIDSTYNNGLNQKYPISSSYQLKFLKMLINHLEQNAEDVHDEIYEAFCTLNSITVDDEKHSYKHYSLPEHNTVLTLKESKSFVANGTTGLCSWQASIALADWLLHNDHLVRDKSVIELGSGTGLCGFIVSKCCKASKVILTDGSSAVIDALNINRNINFPCDKERQEEQCSIVYLPWEECELVGSLKFDVILAADVVYDSTEFDSLVNIIDHLFGLMANKIQMILAATVRNETTLNLFLSFLESRGFITQTKEVVSREKSHLFWDRNTPVKIFKITRNTNAS